MGYTPPGPDNGALSHPPATEAAPELALLFRRIDSALDVSPSSLPQYEGLTRSDVVARAGQLHLTHVNWRQVLPNNSIVMDRWIVLGSGLAQRQTTRWDAARENRTHQAFDYEDHGLSPDELWFEYPEFDRYDHLIFRDSPALEKLGVPEEIRLKPVPAMPPDLEES